MEEEADVFEKQDSKNTNDNKNSQKRRRLKKRLYKTIREQMEFYFSDPNLRNDKFLSSLINQNDDGYVDAEIFLKFNKIKALTSDVNDIIKALSTSQFLKVNDENTKIRRTTPIIEKPNVDECTIYVENLSPHADHDWLKSIFSVYGPVTYISLPRFKPSGKIKGFAFIEFDTPDAAQRACEHFQGITECFVGSGRSQFEHPENNESTESRNGSTKRKHEDDEVQEKATAKKPKLETQSEADESRADKADVEEKEESTGKKTKKKRKRKKKKKVEVEPEVESLSLRVMHKFEWRRCRNKYLSLQKNMMSRVKKSLSLWKDDYGYHDTSFNETASDPVLPPKKNNLEFIPNVILCITTEEPVTDVAGFKQSVRELGNVAYVDAVEGQNTAYVRCADAESANQILNSGASTNTWQKLELLKDEEERAYWDKILKDKEAKWSAKTRLKGRGVQKVFTKAKKVIEAQNKHIHF